MHFGGMHLNSKEQCVCKKYIVIILKFFLYNCVLLQTYVLLNIGPMIIKPYKRFCTELNTQTL